MPKLSIHYIKITYQKLKNQFKIINKYKKKTSSEEDHFEQLIVKQIF